MRVVFMGSPAFGLPTLHSLRSAGHVVSLVVSQPDRPAGRARRLTPPPVAAYARREGLPLYQPERLRGPGALEPIRAAEPDVIAVAAFGLILPSAVLELPPLGCLNVHPSLLPRHRGASPVEAAILDGDAATGVTIIQLTGRMDAGPMLAQQRVRLSGEEEAQDLEPVLAAIGARLLVQSLGPWASGTLRPTPQDEALATYCRKLERADAELDWSRPAERLHRAVRAFRGRIDAFTTWDGKLLKVLAATVTRATRAGEPGTVGLAPGEDGRRYPVVVTGQGGLLLRLVALAGRPPREGPAFLNGYPRFVGARLGPRQTGGEAAQELR